MNPGPQNLREKLFHQCSRTAINPINRRAFLRGTAGALLALPFLKSSPLLRAAAVTPTKRLVSLGVWLSMYPEEWNPAASGYGYIAPRLIQPLEELRNEFTLVSNADHPGVTGGHKGTPAFLSGIYQPERVGQSVVIHNKVTLDQLTKPSHRLRKTRYSGGFYIDTAAESECRRLQLLRWIRCKEISRCGSRTGRGNPVASDHGERRRAKKGKQARRLRSRRDVRAA